MKHIADIEIPKKADRAELLLDAHRVRLTNLGKPFWPELGIIKGDLLQYYADVSPVLLPHLQNRAMVMKRYPNGAFGDFFFMKRAPKKRPWWLQTCSIEHASGNSIDFPVVADLSSLLWVVNLGCIDLNPWYARCDDVYRPDYLHFDLDPVKGDEPVPFSRVRETALLIRATLDKLGMKSFAKTSGSRGIHVYVPIVRGPVQKQVWTFAKALSFRLAADHASLITAEYRVAKRPAGKVLVDYNQNAWGRTLASVYSVRPNVHAAVSAPVTWREVEQGFEISDFTLNNVRRRIQTTGDIWYAMLESGGRVDLGRFL